ncbi:MAG TPA: DUF4349 domain-containing protein [Feifaniaceae bacterium]|nr:DUF4349 domain-containing protein [Feifaniaceae bacterium]
MKRRWLAALLLAVLLIGAGCAAPSQTPAATSAPVAQAAPAAQAPQFEMDNGAAADRAGGWTGGSGEVKGKESAPQEAPAPVPSTAEESGYGGHKIIKTASLGLETREFETDLSYIKQKAVDMGGYIASSYVTGRKPENYGDAGRYANLSLRIPQERMEAFLAEARGVATVTYENSGGEDITSAYFDTESRLKIYETQRDRIMLLLEKAETMEDIITLETELSRLTYEIESLTTQLKRWDDLVDFATVSIDINEIPPAMAVASDDSVGTRISEGFNSTLSGVIVFFENLFVFIVAASPALILIALIAAVIVLIVRGRRRKAAKPAQGAPQPPYQSGCQNALPKKDEGQKDGEQK